MRKLSALTALILLGALIAGCTTPGAETSTTPTPPAPQISVAPTASAPAPTVTSTSGSGLSLQEALARWDQAKLSGDATIMYAMTLWVPVAVKRECEASLNTVQKDLLQEYADKMSSGLAGAKQPDGSLRAIDILAAAGSYMRAVQASCK